MTKVTFKKWLSKGLNWLGKLLGGDILLKFDMGRFLGLVCCIFLLISAMIAWSLTVESDMVKIKDNEKKLEGLRIHYHQAQLNYVGMDSRSTVNKMLETYKSKLHAPACPPNRIILYKQQQNESQP